MVARAHFFTSSPWESQTKTAFSANLSSQNQVWKFKTMKMDSKLSADLRPVGFRVSGSFVLQNVAESEMQYTQLVVIERATKNERVLV
jgi:hypothetical protein